MALFALGFLFFFVIFLYIVKIEDPEQRTMFIADNAGYVAKATILSDLEYTDYPFFKDFCC